MSGISLPYIVEPSTAEGMPIIGPNTVLGNLSSANAFPAQVNVPSLTSLLNPVSTSAQGVMPSISGVSTAYYGGDGIFHPIPATPPSGALILLDTQVASTLSAFIVFTNISSAYPIYQFHLQQIVPSGAGSIIMQVSSNNGASWNTASYINAGNTAAFTTGIALSSGNLAVVGGMNGCIEFPSLGVLASNVVATGTTAWVASGTNGVTLVSGCLIGINTLNAVRFNGGVAWNSGTVRLYGLQG